MALKFRYPGQQIGDKRPDVALSGDPAVDQVALRAAHYAGGKIMTLVQSATPGRGPVLVPLDGSTTDRPYGTLINGCGNYAESIGPSGSGKMPVVRAMPVFELTLDTIEEPSYEATPTTPYTIGRPLYAGPAGEWTPDNPGAGSIVCGTCDHIPTAAEPWLGVAQEF